MRKKGIVNNWHDRIRLVGEREKKKKDVKETTTEQSLSRAGKNV